MGNSLPVRSASAVSGISINPQLRTCPLHHTRGESGNDSFPAPCFSVISQRLAWLTCNTEAASSIAADAFALNRAGSLVSQIRVQVSSNKFTTAQVPSSLPHPAAQMKRPTSGLAQRSLPRHAGGSWMRKESGQSWQQGSFRDATIPPRLSPPGLAIGRNEFPRTQASFPCGRFVVGIPSVKHRFPADSQSSLRARGQSAWSFADGLTRNHI